MSDRTGKSSFLGSLAVFLLSIFLCLLAVEAGIRLMGKKLAERPRNDRPTTYFFSEISRSTRNGPYEEGPLKNGYRVIVVGDSFTFGFNNLPDDAFPQRLGRILNLNEHQPPVEVLNLGRPGNSIRTNAKDAKIAVDQLDPDLVLLEITLNDPEVKPFDDDHHKISVRGESMQAKYPLLSKWKTLGFILQRIENSKSYERYIRYFQHLFTDADTKNNFTAGLSEMQESVRGKKGKLAAVIFPLLTFPLDDSYPFVEAHRLIREELERRKIPYLDLFEAFRGLDPVRLQAIPAEDPHPNEIAHRIAAEAIYKWLVKDKLVPAEAAVHLTDSKRLYVKHLGPKAETESKEPENELKPESDVPGI